MDGAGHYHRQGGEKADSILARIGLNPAMTGDPLGRGFPGAMTMMVVRSLVSNAAHTIGRNSGQQRSGSGNPKPNAPTGPRTSGGNMSNVNAPSYANGYHHSASTQQSNANLASTQDSVSTQTSAAQTDTVQTAAERWRVHSLKLHLLAPASSRTPRGKQPCRPAPDVRRDMWQHRRTMQRPRQPKPRPVRRIVPQELRSLSWAARSCKMRSRNNPYIPSRNPIRAAVRQCRIAAGLF